MIALSVPTATVKLSSKTNTTRSIPAIKEAMTMATRLAPASGEDSVCSVNYQEID